MTSEVRIAKAMCFCCVHGNSHFRSSEVPCKKSRCLGATQLCVRHASRQSQLSPALEHSPGTKHARADVRTAKPIESFHKNLCEPN